MQLKPRRLSPFRLPSDPTGRRAARPGSEKVTVGVPLVKLIKRKLKSSPELVMLARDQSVAAERFHRLKTTLVHDKQDTVRSIVVTSPGPGEGKSLISINLALAFASDSGGEVLLIDGDIRRPGITRWLDPAPKFGLFEILSGKTELEHAILELENSPLKILPAGTPTRDPVELLSSDRARALFGRLRERYEQLIVDTPPIVPFTDADIIGEHCDGLLLVSRADVTHQTMFSRAVRSVTSTRILGVVLNDARHNLADRGYYYDKYYDYYDKARRNSPDK